MAMSIGGNAMTTELEECTYVFNRFPATEKNGLGQVVSGGYPEVTITYDYLSPTNFAWWATTICGGAASATHTSATLYTDLSATASYTNCVVHYPTYESIQGAWYSNVVVKITQIS